MNALERYIMDQYEKGRARFLPVGKFCAKQREAMKTSDNKDEWKESVNVFMAQVRRSTREYTHIEPHIRTLKMKP
jgi:hypothetical protein